LIELESSSWDLWVDESLSTQDEYGVLSSLAVHLLALEDAALHKPGVFLLWLIDAQSTIAAVEHYRASTNL
jgi:hypothetical protein